MKNTVSRLSTRGLILVLTAVFFAIAVIVLPIQQGTKADSDTKAKGLFSRTESEDPTIENYDIRSDKSAVDKIESFRSSANLSAPDVANIRDSFVAGENALKSSVPTLKIEYNKDIRIPEVIAPDVKQGSHYLTTPSGAKHSDILRNFARQNELLVGVDAGQIDALKVTADYTNPAGNMSFASLEQDINGIPVFRGEIKAGFTRSGEIIRVINNLAPGLDYSSLSTDFGDPANAVAAAASNINYKLTNADTTRNNAASTDLKVVFGEGDWATTAEKMYFPTEPGVARTAWRVLIWEPVNAYYVIVDAQTGTMLWRKNISEDQTQSATYNVYANPLSIINTADSPAPLTPGPINPGLGTQGTLLARTDVTLIGNEGTLSFNNNGWITDGANITDGNNLEAGIDRDGINGVDATQAGTPNRVFTSTWNPPPGNPGPGDTPLTAQAQRGAVIQMFYIMNRYHDALYQLGFNEQARNFQTDNFGRGGAGNDRVSAEGQDSSGTNNANFSTPADGGRGRMQMYIFTGPNPQRDGTADADIIIHEVTHGTSNRLHGNGSGLSSNMSRGMGEGWGDWFGFALLSASDDPVNGVYAGGGHLLLNGFGAIGTANYYYGIRRFPKATMASTGGPNNRPFNPLTFADIDASQMNLTDGAFPAMSGPHIATQASQVHAAGEVWSSALWEVRGLMITRLGHVAGNQRAMQVVTDGMKLAPLGPTFLQERNAILAAAQSFGGADVADVWQGFATRGMGFSSSVDVDGDATSTRVTEAFDLPNLLQQPTFAVSDAAGDGDGYPEPGEQLTLSIPLTNTTGNTATGVTLQVVGGGSANYGDIANAQTVSRDVTFTVPGGTGCGTALSLTFNVNSSLGATSFTRSILIGEPVVTASENFDSVTAPAFPAGWTAVPVSGGSNFITSTTVSDSAPNSAFAQEAATVGGGSDLTSPNIAISSAAATVSFRNRYNTEAGWDGGVLEIKIGAGSFQDILAAGGSFIQNGYVGVLGANGANNPLAGRNAWNGDSNGFITTIAQLPASANGQSVQLKWRMGSDDNTIGTGPNPGWYVDTINIVGSYSCNVTPTTSPARADFDGDGKTDVSVFRPSEGNWYLNRSTDGFVAYNFGISTDVLTPADYDGDGKADTSVFRGTADGST